MASYAVDTGAVQYPVLVQRGALSRAGEHIPASAGRVFVATNEEVWRLHGPVLQEGLGGRPHTVLFLPPGEEHKRLASVEQAAEEMVRAGGDRSSVIVAFGGGIVGDMGGFLAAIFMRGIPVIQIPTTLLAQVDAAVGGKTGVNLAAGKNLIGSFHQPLAVIIDPEVIATLPEREYRAGLFEVLKHGMIASDDLFRLMVERQPDVLAREHTAVDYMIGESVRIKSEVVSADEREGGLRRILNFGHTFGHALEAETGYTRFLHGEAVGWGMRAATLLANRAGLLSEADCEALMAGIEMYGPVPSLAGIQAEAIAARLVSDKKTVKGSVHFVLPDRIGHVVVQSGLDEGLVLEAIRIALR